MIEKKADKASAYMYICMYMYYCEWTLQLYSSMAISHGHKDINTSMAIRGN